MNSEKKKVIKVGMPLSYDYQYLYTSLPLVYKAADEITLALDKDRKLWSGKPFSFDEKILDWIREYDTENKIRVYEDRFYIPENTGMQNDTRQRNLMAKAMGAGGWHIQVDTDEFFYDFDRFANWLRQHEQLLKEPDKNPVVIDVFWITLFRKTEKGILYVKDSYESFPIATNNPNYISARETMQNRWRHLNYAVFHQSWARDVEEIRTKIYNWSHMDDFDVEAYFKKWLAADETNYENYHDFHPLNGPNWKKLGFAAGKDIPTFIENYRSEQPLKMPTRRFARIWWREWKQRLKEK
jgi:hypothetical protein